MAVWAYECRPCAGRGEWWVARDDIDTLPPEVRVLRVKAGGGWACGVVDRSRPVAVDVSLLRDARVSDEADCPDCARHLKAAAEAASAEPGAAPAASATGITTASTTTTAGATATTSSGAEINAAAIVLQGQRLLVVLAGLDVVRSPGEADMLIADLRPRFGGIDIVLMGQEDDGTPVYHGDAALLELLADVPVDQMPWKVYPLA